MSILDTAIDARNPAYLENRSTMLERLAQLDAALEEARAGGGEKRVTRHHARGKLLPRERVEMLLDQDAPFLELSPAAAWGSAYPAGASVVTGIGVVEGVECMVIATDPTVDGGAVNPYTMEKIRRAARIAAVNRLPLINLVESIEDGLAPDNLSAAPGAAIARDLSQLTASRIPSVCVVFGETTGGAAYLPALSDYTIMVRGQAKVLTVHPQPTRSGPANGRPEPEVRAAPTVAATVPEPTNQLADHLADDERDALRLARQCVRRINWRKRGPCPRTTPPAPPRFDPEDLLTVTGVHPSWTFQPREVLARILDDSDFDEFRPGHGPALVAGWGELHGYPVGILANVAGEFSAAETQKAAHFIQLANVTSTSLLFLQHSGASPDDDVAPDDARLGAAVVHAVARSKVPHLTLAIGTRPTETAGGLYGRAYEPRFMFAWPAQRPNRTPAQRPDRTPTDKPDPGPERCVILDGPTTLQNDGVIDPRDTRTVLGLCLSAIHSAAVEGAEHVGVVRP